MPSPLEKKRNELAVAARVNGRNSPEAVAAKRALELAHIESYVKRVAAEASPLTDDEIDNVVRILRRPASLVASAGSPRATSRRATND